MTPNQIIRAYSGVQELTGLALPYHTARMLAALKKRLGEEVHVILDMENNLRQKYAGEVTRDNKYRFPDVPSRQAFESDYNAMLEQEEEVKLPAVDLSDFVDELKISAEALAALEEIVTFEKEAENG